MRKILLCIKYEQFKKRITATINKKNTQKIFQQYLVSVQAVANTCSLRHYIILFEVKS